MADGDRRCPSCSRSFGPDVLFCPTDGMPLSRRPSGGGGAPEGPDPYIGIKLLGQIEIKKLAGVGSMARVYRAFQHGIEREVAVKILHRELSSNPEIIERFHREARVASKVAHPNIVQILLTAQLPQDNPQVGGELVLVMEYLDGMSLLSALRASGGALTLPRALHIVLQICDAVGDAHSQGVVHRDLKPENVMLIRRGDDPDFVKVLDFGLARLSTRDASYATRAGAIFGSPRYISPEGAQGLPVGPPADVYAIATILYQCLAGRTPFEAESAVGYLLAHANEPPSRLTSHDRASYVPDPIADVLDQALSKRPEDRPADGRQLGRELLEAARRSGLLSEALVSGSSLYGPRGAGMLASLARTHAMHLVPGVRAEMGNPLSTGTIAGANDEPPPPAPQPRPSSPGRARPPTLPPTGGKASPPPAEAARPPTMPPQLSEPDSAAELLALTSGSGVAPTLFDEPLPAPSATRDASPSRSDETSPPRDPSQSASPMPAAAPAPPAPSPSSSALTTPPTGSASSPSLAPPTTSLSVPSPAPTFLPPRMRSLGTTAALVLACFGGGAGLAVLGASRLGMLPSRAAVSQADALLAEASDAAGRQAWDTPPGQSVVDLLSRGCSEFPADPRFLEAQKSTSEKITMLAIKERNGGRNEEAIRLARLALRFDQKNSVASAIVEELEAISKAPPPPVASAPPPKPPTKRAGSGDHSGHPPSSTKNAGPDKGSDKGSGDKGSSDKGGGTVL